MTAIEDARAVLAAQIEFPDSPIRLHRHGGYVQAMSAYECALHDALRALISEHERLTASANPRKTIADLTAYDAAVSIRAREIVDTRAIFQAVTSPPTDAEREQIGSWLGLADHADRVADERDDPLIAELSDALRAAVAGFRRQGPITDEWEYGVTTKWGVTGPRSLAGAQEYAALICAEIESCRSSGDLSHHGHLRRRRPARQPGPWEPVES